MALRINTLMEAATHLETMAEAVRSDFRCRGELREVAAFLNEEDGLKAMHQTLDDMTPRQKSLGPRIPLVRAREAIAEARRRTAAVDAEGPELSRLRVRVRVLERELRDLRAAIEDL